MASPVDSRLTRPDRNWTATPDVAASLSSIFDRLEKPDAARLVRLAQQGELVALKGFAKAWELRTTVSSGGTPRIYFTTDDAIVHLEMKKSTSISGPTNNAIASGLAATKVQATVPIYIGFVPEGTKLEPYFGTNKPANLLDTRESVEQFRATCLEAQLATSNKPNPPLVPRQQPHQPTNNGPEVVQPGPPMISASVGEATPVKHVDLSEPLRDVDHRVLAQYIRFTDVRTSVLELAESMSIADQQIEQARDQLREARQRSLPKPIVQAPAFATTAPVVITEKGGFFKAMLRLVSRPPTPEPVKVQVVQPVPRPVIDTSRDDAIHAASQGVDRLIKERSELSTDDTKLQKRRYEALIDIGNGALAEEQFAHYAHLTALA